MVTSPQAVSDVNIFDPTPAGHNKYVNVRIYRIFVRLNGRTVMYAFAYNDHSFRINDFIKYMAKYGFDVFAPVARLGPYDARTGDSAPAQRFGEVVQRWWRSDERSFSKGIHMSGMHPWSFKDLWDRMHELGFGISSVPY